MSDRTKGPWYADESGNVFTSPDRKTHRRLIANCGGFQSSRDDGSVVGENMANAEFIAAAPKTAEQRDELLTACWAAVEYTAERGCALNPRMIKTLRAAIANAEEKP